VKIDFSEVDSKRDRFYTEEFRHTPSIADGYDMLLNEAFCEKTWPWLKPGPLMIRAGKGQNMTPGMPFTIDKIHL
jgi:hypothetical protein